MKVIDLLNKIANGEEVPKRFMYDDKEFYLQSKDCWRCDDAIFEECFILEDLNKEVEIIEEDKKIEKLDTLPFYKEAQLVSKINEIIDIVNKLKVDRK